MADSMHDPHGLQAIWHRGGSPELCQPLPSIFNIQLPVQLLLFGFLLAVHTLDIFGYALALIYDEMACPLMTGETKAQRHSIFRSSVTRFAMRALVLVTGCGKFLSYN